MSLNQLVDSRDVRFVVFEMLEIDKLKRFDRFADLDRSMYPPFDSGSKRY